MAFIELEQRARAAQTVTELAFILANNTISLVHFSQAAVFDEKGKLVCLSGVSMPDDGSPFSHFLDRLIRYLPQESAAPLKIEKSALSQDLQDDWDDWFFLNAIWVPVGNTGLSFLVVREEPFTNIELQWLATLGEVFVHARKALLKREPLRFRHWTPPGLKVGAVACAGLILVAPIPLTVLAPAEIVAANPTIVRSPIDAVIDKIFVRPNEVVEAGQHLVDLDTTTISNKLDVAIQDLAAAQAEYRQTMQQAVSDPKSRAQLAAIEGRIEIRASEVAYLKILRQRAHLTAPISGLAIFDDPTELVGRPISIGEKIIGIAEANDIEIEAWVGLADAIAVPPSADVMLVLNAEPLNPVHGNVRYIAYDAQTRPDGTTGYRLRASLVQNAPLPRLGARGTLRLKGERVTVAYWLFRRPLAAIRQFLGL